MMIDKQNIRLGFIFVMVVIGLFLFNAWQNDKQTKAQLVQQAQHALAANQSDIPTSITAATNNAQATPATPTLASVNPNRIVTVKTDVYNLKIDLLGGDIVYLDLPKYPVSLEDQNQGFVLLDETKDRFYIVQSGLLNEHGP